MCNRPPKSVTLEYLTQDERDIYDIAQNILTAFQLLAEGRFYAEHLPRDLKHSTQLIIKKINRYHLYE